MTASPEGAEVSKRQIVKDDHLPVSEFLFDRAGAGSPYGEELEFPLPTDGLGYRHAEPQPRRER